MEVNSHLCQSVTLWKSSSKAAILSASNWQSAQLSLSSGSDFKLIFEGTIPAGNPNARICVDNITAYHRPCHQIAASAYAASMRRWLEPMIFVFVGALASALLIVVAFFAIRVSRRRGKKSPAGSASSSDGSASPQHHLVGVGSSNGRRRGQHQQEAMLLHAERIAAVPQGGPRRPAPPVPASQPSLDELLRGASQAASTSQEPPPRYEEAMGLVGAGSSAGVVGDQQASVSPPPFPPRVMRKNGNGRVV